jgi:hypothetical protein
MAGMSDREWVQYVQNRSSLLDAIESDKHHVERMRALQAEKDAHTYRLKIREIEFSLYLQWTEIKEEDGCPSLWIKMEASMLPESLIPEGISRELVGRALYKIGYKGFIEGRFYGENGVFVASDGWMERYAYVIERIRKSMKK